MLSVVGFLWTVKILLSCLLSITKNATTDVTSNQPIACPSDQQAGHVTRRPTIASKNSSQGLSQQLSNLQIRRAFKRNTLINGGNAQKIQHKFNTKDSCKLASATGYRVYRPGTSYTALYSCFHNCLQSAPTRYRLHSLCAAYPTQTGYRVIRPSPFNSVLILGQVDSKYLQIWLQLVTESSNHQTSLPAIQPYFHHNRLQSDHFNHWLQSLPTRYWLYSLASPKPVTESTHLVHSTLC